MYAFTLIAHSWIRWIVIASGLALLLRSLAAWRRTAEWSDGLDRLQRTFLGALDLQFLLGLLLYFWLSPLVDTALKDLGVAMGDHVLRFFAVEHAFGMLVGVLIAHAGLALSRSRPSARRCRAVFITMTLWFLVTLGSVPWPGLPYERPLLRF